MTVKSIFDAQAYKEILARIENLTPATQGLWGKMDVAQMLKHCTQQIKIATGDTKIPRLWIGWLFGGFLKSALTDDKPFGKNSPTLPSFKIVEKVDFQLAKTELLQYLDKLIKQGEKSTEGYLHPFFGVLTAEQWNKGTWKHLNHHLSQFGV